VAKNYKEYDIKRPGFTDGIKVRIFKTPESMQKGYLTERAKFTQCKHTGDLTSTMGICFNVPLIRTAEAGGGRIVDYYLIHQHYLQRYSTHEANTLLKILDTSSVRIKE
jgi:hypothetical protein